jgi:hypothetical protein
VDAAVVKERSPRSIDERQSAPVAASNAQRGQLHIVKDCSAFTAINFPYCTPSHSPASLKFQPALSETLVPALSLFTTSQAVIGPEYCTVT